MVGFPSFFYTALNFLFVLEIMQLAQLVHVADGRSCGREVILDYSSLVTFAGEEISLDPLVRRWTIIDFGLEDGVVISRENKAIVSFRLAMGEGLIALMKPSLKTLSLIPLVPQFISVQDNQVLLFEILTHAA